MEQPIPVPLWTDSSLPPLPCEQLIIEATYPREFRDAIVVSPGQAQSAVQLISEHPTAGVTAWFMDLFQAEMVRKTWEAETRTVPPIRSVESLPQIVCQPDLPEQPCQLILMPILKRGNAELNRELMQQAYLRLDEEGILVVAVDNPNDQWLNEQMRILFPKVRTETSKRGTVYWGRKRGPLKRIRDFSCQYLFKDHDRMIPAISRPGVFSHRRLDPGARQLLNTCDVGPEDRVLDIGCGSGGIALACAFQTTGDVVGVDCNARAIDCLQRGAELNGLDNVKGILNADGNLGETEKYELALANPPYFGNHQISEHFLKIARENLVEGGALLVVTKSPNWFVEAMAADFEDLEAFPSGHYHVVCGHRL